MLIYLLCYRNTPVKGMSASPAHLCAGRRLRTKIPVLTSKLTPKIPTNVKQELLKKQTTQKIYYDKTARELPQLNIGNKVLLKQGNSVEPAKLIAKHDSPRSFIVTTPDGGEYRRNRNSFLINNQKRMYCLKKKKKKRGDVAVDNTRYMYYRH